MFCKIDAVLEQKTLDIAKIPQSLKQSTLDHMDCFQLKSTNIKQLRDYIFNTQGKRCFICNCTDPLQMTLDHQHKRKYDEVNKNGDGMVRGVLCRACNTIEGKFINSCKRFKIKEPKLFLENLLKYYNNGTYNIIHSKEKKKLPKVSKKQYNKLKEKLSQENKKISRLNKNRYLTKALYKQFKTYGIIPFTEGDAKLYNLK